MVEAVVLISTTGCKAVGIYDFSMLYSFHILCTFRQNLSGPVLSPSESGMEFELRTSSLLDGCSYHLNYMPNPRRDS
jgi:hypothetical protein